MALITITRKLTSPTELTEISSVLRVHACVCMSVCVALCGPIAHSDPCTHRHGHDRTTPSPRGSPAVARSAPSLAPAPPCPRSSTWQALAPVCVSRHTVCHFLSLAFSTWHDSPATPPCCCTVSLLLGSFPGAQHSPAQTHCGLLNRTLVGGPLCSLQVELTQTTLPRTFTYRALHGHRLSLLWMNAQECDCWVTQETHC